MRSAIFIWSGLLLIGSISISQCYPESSEDSDENRLDKFIARAGSRFESSESKRGEWFNKRASSCTTACKPACRAGELCLASGVCTCPGGGGNSPCTTQYNGLCAPSETAGVKPVVSITFGEGVNKFSDAKPATLGFSTSYSQVSGQTVHDGSFEITNVVPQDFGSWLGGGLDHTTHCSAGSSKGYMMIVNGKVAASGDILSTKAENLCLGLLYQFSFYVANIVKAGTGIALPDIQIEVRNAAGAKVASLATGGIAEQSKLTWIKYGASFVATSSSATIIISTNIPGGTGNDFALDDITLTSCAPRYNGVCA